MLDYKGHIFKRGRECDLTHCQMSNVNDSCLQQIQRKASPEFWHSFQDKGDFILYWKLIWNASYENITRVRDPRSWQPSSSFCLQLAECAAAMWVHPSIIQHVPRNTLFIISYIIIRFSFSPSLSHFRHGHLNTNIFLQQFRRQGSMVDLKAF